MARPELEAEEMGEEEEEEERSSSCWWCGRKLAVLGLRTTYAHRGPFIFSRVGVAAGRRRGRRGARARRAPLRAAPPPAGGRVPGRAQHVPRAARRAAAAAQQEAVQAQQGMGVLPGANRADGEPLPQPLRREPVPRVAHSRRLRGEGQRARRPLVQRHPRLRLRLRAQEPAVPALHPDGVARHAAAGGGRGARGGRQGVRRGQLRSAREPHGPLRLPGVAGGGLPGGRHGGGGGVGVRRKAALRPAARGPPPAQRAAPQAQRPAALLQPDPVPPRQGVGAPAGGRGPPRVHGGQPAGRERVLLRVERRTHAPARGRAQRPRRLVRRGPPLRLRPRAPRHQGAELHADDVAQHAPAGAGGGARPRRPRHRRRQLLPARQYRGAVPRQRATALRRPGRRRRHRRRLRRRLRRHGRRRRRRR